MDPRNYLTLILRRWKEILAFGLVFLLVSAAWTLFFAQTQYRSTLFFTVAGENKGISLYEDTRGADLFSETVQGWTKNPGLVAEIGDKTGEKFGISGRVQESQNVVVELSADSEEGIKKVSEETLNVLKTKVNEFNKETNHTFTLAIPTTEYTTEEPGLGKNELIFLLIGLIIGLGFAFLYEYMTDKASFEHQVEEMLGEKIVGKGKEMLNFLKEKLASHEILDLSSNQNEKIGGKENLIILVELGKTKLKDLKHTKVNSKAKIYPIIKK